MTTPATALCSCGSKLRPARCCAADPAALPGEHALALLVGQAQEAIALFNAKNYEAAESHALALLDLAPNLRLALRVLFEIRKAEGQNEAASALALRLAALPGPAALRAAANTLCAQFLVSLGQYQAASAPAAAALIATPRDPVAHHLMGVVLTETGRLAAGERHYRRAQILLGAPDGLVLANTAWNLKLQGRLNEASAMYETALTLRPENRRGVGGQAQVEYARGDHPRAIALLEAGIIRWPDDRSLALLRAMADLRAAPKSALDRLGAAPETLSSVELCLRGQALDRLGDPAAAYACFTQAKARQRARTGTYEPKYYVEKSDFYKEYFTSDRILPLPRPDSLPGPSPIFLLGFPRAGTGLLEQLLAQIPGIAPGGDQEPIADLAAGLAHYPDCLDQMLLEDGAILPAALAARYAQAGLAAARPGARYITDRAAGNAWHLGLIKLLFPDAPIIHLLRHPLDVALSNFMQDRRLQANCGVSLPAIARHYALTMELIAHYRGQLALRYLPVRYEDLVAAPAATLSRILAFIGADAAACPPEDALRANAAPLPDPAPSHMAVREPLHSRAAFRHRRFAAAIPGLFAEVQDILAPWIDALGYADAP